MRSSLWCALLLCSAVMIAALASSSAFGGIVVISRDSRITVDGIGQGTPFNRDRTFSGSGTFADTVAGEEGSRPDGAFAHGNATQTTFLEFTPSGGPFTGFGNVHVDVFAQLAGEPQSGNQVSADSILEVVFRVLNFNEPFQINGEFETLDLFPNASVRLINADASPTTPDLFNVENDSEVRVDPKFDSGVISLPPAEYRLTLTASAGSSGIGPGGVEPFGQESGIFFEFTVGEPIEPPPVIPLPAGVWAGIVGLTAAAGALRSRRLR
jgi:hypothetical protein